MQKCRVPLQDNPAYFRLGLMGRWKYSMG